jgi:hypothetical protein
MNNAMDILEKVRNQRIKAEMNIESLKTQRDRRLTEEKEKKKTRLEKHMSYYE